MATNSSCLLPRMKNKEQIEKAAGVQVVICIRNEDCEDLELRKIYQVLPDESAAKVGYIREIDESGEDYLYPADYFVSVELPQVIKKVFARTG